MDDHRISSAAPAKAPSIVDPPSAQLVALARDLAARTRAERGALSLEEIEYEAHCRGLDIHFLFRVDEGIYAFIVRRDGQTVGLIYERQQAAQQSFVAAGLPLAEARR